MADAGSFSRAAEESFVAQSAVSKQIAQLEAELGVSLLERSSRGATLTGAGMRLEPVARRMLADVEHAREEMSALVSLKKGLLRLGILQSSGGPIDLAELLGDYRTRHPGIEFRIRTLPSGEMANEVARGRLDLAIVGLPPDELPANLAYELIFEDTFVGVFSRAAADNAPTPLPFGELLRRGPFIQYTARSGIRAALEGAAARAGVQIDAAFELDRGTDMLDLAASGAGVTALPSMTARHAAAGPAGARFEMRPLADRQLVHPVGIICDNARLSPAASSMIDVLRDRMS